MAQQCLDYWINSRIYFGQISASVKFAHLLKEKSSGVDVYETSKLQAKLPGNKADMPKCFHGVFSLFHTWCASAHWRYQKQRPIYAANILGAKKLSVRRFSRGQGINLQPYCRMVKILMQSARKEAENHILSNTRQLNQAALMYIILYAHCFAGISHMKPAKADALTALNCRMQRLLYIR